MVHQLQIETINKRRRLFTMNMLQQSIMILISTLLLITSGCDLQSTTDIEPGEPEPIERRELPRALTGDEMQIVNGSGVFGFNMMHKLLETEPDKNHFISPFSILMAYGMTMNGADGETYEQIQEVFGLESMSRDQINLAARDLIDLLTEFDEKVQFNVANSIWYRDTFGVEQEFLETNREAFDAVIEAADFSDPETVDIINQWVSDSTQGLIEEIVEGPVNPLTMLYLINAIYFNGEWTIQFDPEDTEIKPFFKRDGSEVDVEMMKLDMVENTEFAVGDDFRAVNLYYGNAGYAMTLVLPDEGIFLSDWLTNKNWSDWRELTDSISGVTLNLEMPKFELEYELEEFGNLLQELGMENAFDANLSDFSRINPNQEDLHISDTRHKTFIRVDEEGTEAAAVTSVEIGVTSAPQSFTIRFDRPYFYMIREVESGTILFMGTMADPTM
jgi:serine protease inhibitor